MVSNREPSKAGSHFRRMETQHRTRQMDLSKANSHCRSRRLMFLSTRTCMVILWLAQLVQPRLRCRVMEDGHSSNPLSSRLRRITSPLSTTSINPTMVRSRDSRALMDIQLSRFTRSINITSRVLRHRRTSSRRDSSRSSRVPFKPISSNTVPLLPLPGQPDQRPWPPITAICRAFPIIRSRSLPRSSMNVRAWPHRQRRRPAAVNPDCQASAAPGLRKKRMR